MALSELEVARLALADLKRNNTTEITSFDPPPEAVEVNLVLERMTASRNRVK